MPPASAANLLAQLTEKFGEDEVKQRKADNKSNKMLDYVSIDSTIRRLNNVLAEKWSFTLTDTPPVVPAGEDKYGNTKYLAIVAGELSALSKTAAGVGADIATDPDKAIKTALAEAIKKAGHQFGIGLELWDEGYRNELEVQRNLTTVAANATASGDTLKALQTQAAKKAIAGGSAPEAQSIAEFFGLTVEDFKNEDLLRSHLA